MYLNSMQNDEWEISEEILNTETLIKISDRKRFSEFANQISY